MNPGPTVERVIETLRRQIFENRFQPGDRLEPSAIATELVASVTPVRDALNRLAGEDLVEIRSSGGFRLPTIDEPLLQDLYQWSQQLLIVAISSWPQAQTLAALAVEPHSKEGTLADRTARLCMAVATASTNGQHAAAMRRLNGRLHVARTLEPQVLDTGDSELDEWVEIIGKNDRQSLRTTIAGYHKRRFRAAASIVRAIYRNT